MPHNGMFMFSCVCIGELSWAGDAGCTCDGQGRFCQVAHRKWSEHAPFPNHQSAGGALQHGNVKHHAPVQKKKETKRLGLHQVRVAFTVCFRFEASAFGISIHRLRSDTLKIHMQQLQCDSLQCDSTQCSSVPYDGIRRYKRMMLCNAMSLNIYLSTELLNIILKLKLFTKWLSSQHNVFCKLNLTH